jgi:hypothetical protein
VNPGDIAHVALDLSVDEIAVPGSPPRRRAFRKRLGRLIASFDIG